MRDSARTILKEIYEDFWNNYLSIQKFAEDNGLTSEQGDDLVNLARDVFYSNHPEE